MTTQTAWAHGCDVIGEKTAPTTLNVTDFGTSASAPPPGGPHFLRLVVPAPSSIDDKPIQITQIFLRYRTSGGASIINIRLFDCESNLDTLNVSLSHTTFITAILAPTLGAPLPVTIGAVAFSIEVVFPPSGGRVDIAGAGFEFTLT